MDFGSKLEVNQESAQAVKDYLKNGKSGTLYTFTSFFINNNYIKSDKDLQHRGSNLFTHCPFHHDKTPSFSFSEQRGICNCFSCGFGGTYIDLVLKYENEVNGRNITYYGLLDEFLRNDSIMQATLGFSTIYTTYNIFENEFKFKPFHPKNLRKPYIPSKYLELANRIKKDKLSKEDIFEFILSMQAGIPAAKIYYQLYGDEDLSQVDFGEARFNQASDKEAVDTGNSNVSGSDIKNKKVYDFSKLLGHE